MTYYRDLSPYEYWKTVWPPNPPENAERLLNVGWLGGGRDFPTGDCPTGFVDHLIDRASGPARLARGVHHCEFCDRRSPLQVTNKESGSTAYLGNGEIIVMAASGEIYAAPTLIIHYVIDHDYLPPVEFIEAVMKRVD
ncbi:DUF7919 family protein [Streptomyces sp. NPDC001606]